MQLKIESSEQIHSSRCHGEFVDIANERYYAIRNVDKMPPFFVSLVSNSDHWMFVSSTGGLTAGRVSPDTALFPYVTVDKIYDSTADTGSTTLLRVAADGEQYLWEPFKQNTVPFFHTSRNLYKNILGNKICFEEINHDLNLAFRYYWSSSDVYGFVRHCNLENLSAHQVSVELLDGLQNILPASTPRFAQTNTSNLVDAYKWTELDTKSGLALFTLYSEITDRAEPRESLKANSVFCLGLDTPQILLSSLQIEEFRAGRNPHQETKKRGIRGAYLAYTAITIPAFATHHWQFVANIEQSQSQVVALNRELQNPTELWEAIAETIEQGSDELARILASADAFQITADENVSVHHTANVLFNTLRGGIFNDHYRVSSWDFRSTIKQMNSVIAARHLQFFNALPDSLEFYELLDTVRQSGDIQFERLCYEYLPIRFGRRHGDPSRPWNNFSIKLQDSKGHPLLSYEGNWRDIFQNWEALLISYPEFTENVIAKFVNASTVDGYNPYRITKQGIDWEEEEPDNPWSYIGYWGDHQIIYLLKLLELSQQYHPSLLSKLLHHPIFCYANVPYRIKPFASLLANPKNTVTYDNSLAETIEQRVTDIGADGKLILDANGVVYQVNLIEKLLVPLLSKLANLVVDGGIWLNTQRPEWNDANNALVGHGLSMVTLNYLRRYITFLTELLSREAKDVDLSGEVATWLKETALILRNARPHFDLSSVSDTQRFKILSELGEAASRYRQVIYEQASFSVLSTVERRQVLEMLADARSAVDHSIVSSRREDGLYHAYNLLSIEKEHAGVDTLYPMLEGQVAALSSGAIHPNDAADIVEALFNSEVYRPDQNTFMLYPDRTLPSFLEKNRIPKDKISTISFLQTLFERNDDSLVLQDEDGHYRFNSDFSNVNDLNSQLDRLTSTYGTEAEAARLPLQSLYESVFNHKAFTGRSGGMFGFEGLGSVYWHMVAKLLLAVQENYFAAIDQGCDEAVCQRLGNFYYRVREGIGFNKTASEYGAFPMDPYSHTPKHSGAQQPGMTGQVKEEILTRFGELGIRVKEGIVYFEPKLLLKREFVSESQLFRYLDISGRWQELVVAPHCLAFTWCQVPIIYQLDETATPGVTATYNDNTQEKFEPLTMGADASRALFVRNNRIRHISVVLNSDHLFDQ